MDSTVVLYTDIRRSLRDQLRVIAAKEGTTIKRLVDEAVVALVEQRSRAQIGESALDAKGGA